MTTGVGFDRIAFAFAFTTTSALHSHTASRWLLVPLSSSPYSSSCSSVPIHIIWNKSPLIPTHRSQSVHLFSYNENMVMTMNRAAVGANAGDHHRIAAE